MSQQLGFFEPPPPVAAPRPDRPLDVIRVLEHKAGPFRQLRVRHEDSVVYVAGEYVVVQRPTGFYAQFTDGRPERFLPNIDAAFVDAMVRERTWREVEP